jgi:hypothetical protein
MDAFMTNYGFKVKGGYELTWRNVDSIVLCMPVVENSRIEIEVPVDRLKVRED